MPGSEKNAAAGPVLRILHVEDDTQYAAFIRQCLSGGGKPFFALEWVPTLRMAMERLSNETFDLVLLDLNLPDSLGLDTIRAVRGTAAETAIVVLTQLGDESLAELLLRAGIQDFLAKDEVDHVAIRRAIFYSIQRKRAERELQASREQVRQLQLSQDAILRAMPAALCTLDYNWSVVWANERMQRDLLGPESKGRNFADLMRGPDEFEHLVMEVHGQKETHVPLRRELPLRGLGGNFRWYLTSIVHLDPASTTAGYLATLIDVSDRREAELQREGLMTISQRLAGASSYTEAGNILAQESRALFRHDSFWFSLYDPSDHSLQHVWLEDTPAGASQPCPLACGARETWPVPLTLFADGKPQLINRRGGSDIMDLDAYVMLLRAKYPPLSPAAGARTPGGRKSPDFGQRRFKSILFAPIQLEGALIGGLTLLSYGDRSYGETDLHLLQAFAGQCGTVLSQLRTREQLLRSEALHRCIVEDQTEMIVRLTPEFELIYANRPFCQQVCQNPAGAECDLAGTSFFNFLPHVELGRIRKHLESLTPERSVAPIESVLEGTEGRQCRTLWTCRAIYGEDRQLISYQLVGSDVTQLRLAESALARTEQRLELIVTQMPAMIWTTDLDLNFTSIMGQGFNFPQFDAKQVAGLVGMNVRDIFRRQERDSAVVEAHREAIDSGASGQYRVVWNERRYDARVEPLRRNDGTISGVVGVALDVTERLRTEEERVRLEESLHESERLAGIGQAMAKTGHCMKNILTGLKGGVFLLDRCLAADPGNEQLQEARFLLSRSTARINLLLQNMLDLARDRTPGHVLAPIDELMQEAAAVIRSGARALADGTAIEIEAAADPAARTFRVDPERFYRTLLNLGLNAVDAMEGGGRLELQARVVPAEEVAAHCHGPAGNGNGASAAEEWQWRIVHAQGVMPAPHLRIDVADTGSGIAPENLTNLFDLFFSTKSGKGTGLGLACARQFVEDHRGHILIRTAPGRGSMFTLLLPELLVPARAEAAPAVMEGSGVDGVNGGAGLNGAEHDGHAP